MNIYFVREGTTVVANVVINVPLWDERVFSFKFECGSDAYAGLLAKEMQAQLSSELEAIRMNEYQAGWKEKAAHKGAQRGWFASTFKWRNK